MLRLVVGGASRPQGGVVWRQSKVHPGATYIKPFCRCGGRVLTYWEPVRRKRHTPTGKRMRLVARCTRCGVEEVIRHGA